MAATLNSNEIQIREDLFHKANWPKEFVNKLCQILHDKFGFIVNKCPNNSFWYVERSYDHDDHSFDQETTRCFKFGTVYGSDYIQMSLINEEKFQHIYLPGHNTPKHITPLRLAMFVATKEVELRLIYDYTTSK